jgi:hypothetical protein
MSFDDSILRTLSEPGNLTVQNQPENRIVDYKLDSRHDQVRQALLG